jgi:conjugal transfer pilus assembly protein TraF
MLSKGDKKIVLFLPLSALLLSAILLFGCQNIFAKVFYEGHAEGWHWYADPEKEAQETNAMKQEEIAVKDPNKEMEVLRATIQRALNKAILYPTEANIKDYIDLQNRLSNQSTIFADIWQKVLLENPGLNYALVHPTNALAKQVDLDLQTKKEIRDKIDKKE